MNKRKLWVSILAGIMAAVMLLSLIIGILPSAANADELLSSSEIEKQIEELKNKGDAIEDKIDELEGKLSDNMSEMEQMVAQKNIIDQEIALLYQQISNVNAQISAYGLLIADKQDELDAAQARLEKMREQNRDRIRAMEEDGKLSYWSVLFKANSFSDLLDRLEMIEEIDAADRRRIKEMDAAAKEVAAAQADLETKKAELLEAKEGLVAMQAQQQEKRAETDRLLSELNALGEEYEEFIHEQEIAMEQLSSEIAQKNKELEEAEEREYQQWLSTSVPPTTAPKPSGGSSSGSTATPPPPNPGGWVMPCKYILFTSPYGMRLHPIHKVWMMHGGVDLAANEGTPIWASRGGVVTTAEWSDAYGWYVVVNHGDGFATLYAHMTHFVVSVGDKVGAGTTIGYMGSTGNSTGPHLHFEIHYNGSTVNPADYINITYWG